MADAASFFASKKKNKKPFKFNANKIDASTVTSTVHVDAPALSTYADGPSSGGMSLSAISALSGAGKIDPRNGNYLDDGNEQWDDEALAAATTRKNAATVAIPSSAVTSKDLAVDIKALDLKGSYNDELDIAERLRLEETRAQLAAAREGMEREAQRMKEEKEKKELAASTRMGASATGGSGGDTGGKWVPSRLRAGGSSLTTGERFGMAGLSSSTSQRVNTEDENLFPDLAAAEAIIEKQKQEQPAFMASKKTPVGGGATWGSRPKLNLKPKTATPSAEESQEGTSSGLTTEEPAVADAAVDDDAAAGTSARAETEEQSAMEEPVIEAPGEVAVSTITPEPSTAESSATDGATASAPAAAPIKPTKKKKKDVSTFKK